MKNNIFLTLTLMGLLVGSSYITAWTGPTASAPNGNVASPINIGATTQVKTGDLGVADFIADSILSLGIVQSNTQMRSPEYCDENGVNCEIPGTTNSDDEDDTDTVTVGGTCFEPAFLVTCNWNWSGDGSDNTTYIFYGSDPSLVCTTEGRTYKSHSIVLAECSPTTYYWSTGPWVTVSSKACAISGQTLTQTRTVSCVSGSGTVVPDTNCYAAKPSTSQTVGPFCVNHEKPS